MKRHTKAINKLAMRMESDEIEGPVETRKISIRDAAQEIYKLFNKQKILYYSEIAETLNLDFSTIIQACKKLEEDGLIEGASGEPEKT